MVNNPATIRRPTMSTFTQVILYTDTDGFAKFREETIPLNAGNPQSMLSEVFASGGYQLRTSPVGFRSQFHCSGHTQWCFILQGQMEIGVHGELTRLRARTSTFIQQICCPRVPRLTPPSTATGAAKWVTSLRSPCLSRG